jgi:hypothetical protein
VGKSSLIAYVCSRLPETYVAFRLPVTGADDPTSVSVMASMALGIALRAIELEEQQRPALEFARAESAVTERGEPRVTSGKLGGGPVPAEVNAGRWRRSGMAARPPRSSATASRSRW